jgi:LacI family transcriptional regulator
LTIEAGYAYGRVLLAAKPTPRAVFCGNDMVAYGFHRAAVERGLRISKCLSEDTLNRWSHL